MLALCTVGGLGAARSPLASLLLLTGMKPERLGGTERQGMAATTSTCSISRQKQLSSLPLARQLPK
jgi:hypothetical protein